MPRYFFNVRDGSDLPDTEGTVLTDLRSARIEAVKLAGALLAQHPSRFWEGDEWHIEVTDERRLILFRLDFTATDAPTLTDP